VDVWSELEASYLLVDYEKGKIEVRDRNLMRYYVRVAYTSGFEVDGGDATLFTGVPEWLQLSAATKSQQLLMNNPLLNFEGTQKPEVSDLTASYSRSVLPHVRYAPLGNHPLNYTVVP
jgi:hypothetical protein